ncbi:hypothetical protein AAY473_016745 [Plecturocebus cupreus]
MLWLFEDKSQQLFTKHLVWYCVLGTGRFGADQAKSCILKQLTQGQDEAEVQWHDLGSLKSPPPRFKRFSCLSFLSRRFLSISLAKTSNLRLLQLAYLLLLPHSRERSRGKTETVKSLAIEVHRSQEIPSCVLHSGCKLVFMHGCTLSTPNNREGREGRQKLWQPDLLELLVQGCLCPPLSHIIPSTVYTNGTKSFKTQRLHLECGPWGRKVGLVPDDPSQTMQWHRTAKKWFADACWLLVFPVLA